MDNLVLKTQVEANPTYNAYEKDIALVNFYFDKSSILQFTRQERMTIVDYISQMGGLLGLFIGFSFISGIEDTNSVLLMCATLLCALIAKLKVIHNINNKILIFFIFLFISVIIIFCKGTIFYLS